MISRRLKYRFPDKSVFKHLSLYTPPGVDCLRNETASNSNIPISVGNIQYLFLFPIDHNSIRTWSQISNKWEVKRNMEYSWFQLNDQITKSNLVSEMPFGLPVSKYSPWLTVNSSHSLQAMELDLDTIVVFVRNETCHHPLYFYRCVRLWHILVELLVTLLTSTEH